MQRLGTQQWRLHQAPWQDKSQQLIKVGVQAAGIEVNDTEPLEPALPAGQSRASSQGRKERKVPRRTTVQLDATSKDQKSQH